MPASRPKTRTSPRRDELRAGIDVADDDDVAGVMQRLPAAQRRRRDRASLGGASTRCSSGGPSARSAARLWRAARWPRRACAACAMSSRAPAKSATSDRADVRESRCRHRAAIRSSAPPSCCERFDASLARQPRLGRAASARSAMPASCEKVAQARQLFRRRHGRRQNSPSPRMPAIEARLLGEASFQLVEGLLEVAPGERHFKAVPPSAQECHGTALREVERHSPLRHPQMTRNS